MSNNNNNKIETIKVYCRLRPIEEKSKQNEEPIKYVIEKHDSGFDFLLVKCVDLYGTSTNQQNSFKFQYQEVFDENDSQLSIFENVAAPIVNNFICGVNGTIFTYGQTGSGKTHTICGSEEEEGRGIIPRTFQHLFDTIASISHEADEESVKYEVTVTYIEIYNEIVYDLLSSAPDNQIIHSEKCNVETDEEDYDQLTNTVTVLVDKKGHISFQHLSVHPVKNLSEALTLIKDGDYQRKIAETPMNIQSSRSHCICTIHLSRRNNNSPAMIYTSKLNLVDLAGSERIWKSKVGKRTLSEARYINLSLHYLEQVITTLTNSTNKIHVPYRNSVMTSILRDSLGGNCFTAMVANIVLNNQCIAESISTCRFSQRVATVDNYIRENWCYDSTKEIALYRNEMELLRKRNNDEIMLDEKETTECNKLIDNYVLDTKSELKLPVNRNKIKYCFELMKNAINEIKIDKEDRTSVANSSSMYDDFLRSFDMVERKVHVDDKKITVLIQDHNKNKVMYASSDDKRIIKKLNKLQWNVFEELNDDGTDEADEQNTSYERRSKSREGARGDGSADVQDEPRADAAAAAAAAAAQHEKSSRHDRAWETDRRRHRSADDAAAVHAPPPLTGHSCFFHVIPCTQNSHRAELDCRLCSPFHAQLCCATASSCPATWTDDRRGN